MLTVLGSILKKQKQTNKCLGHTHFEFNSKTRCGYLKPQIDTDTDSDMLHHYCVCIRHAAEVYLLTSSSRKALSHSFWPGACWVHSVMSWLMLSVTALKHIAHNTVWTPHHISWNKNVSRWKKSFVVSTKLSVVLCRHHQILISLTEF